MLDDPIKLMVDVIAKRFDERNQKQTMHVQGMSYWAPANIGPYSQSVMVSECWAAEACGGGPFSSM
jgi:diphthine-ammonia ligase